MIKTKEGGGGLEFVDKVEKAGVKYFAGFTNGFKEEWESVSSNISKNHFDKFSWIWTIEEFFDKNERDEPFEKIVFEWKCVRNT